MKLSRAQFILIVLCFFAPERLLAEDRETTAGFPQFQYDQAALTQVAAADTAEAMIDIMRNHFGVTVLEVPKTHPSREALAEKYGPEATMYFHMNQSLQNGTPTFRFKGQFVAPYSPMGTEDSRFPIIGWKDRPAGDKEVILLTEKAPREVILHEFMHLLISRERVKASGLTAQKFQEQRSARFSRFENPDSPGNQDPVELLTTMSEQAQASLSEELAINLTLIKLRDSLGLSFESAQNLLGINERNFEHYGHSTIRELRNALDAAPDFLKPPVRTILTELVASVENYRATVDQESTTVPRARQLRKLNVHGIVLNKPNLAAMSPYGVLGLPAGITDPDLVKAAYLYWVHDFHPDKGGNAEHFKALTTAKNDLLKAIANGSIHRGGSAQHQAFNEAMAAREREILATLAGFKRWATRTATMCVAGAIYCALDESLPWSRGVGFEFGWNYVMMSTALASLNGTKHDDTLPETQRSAVPDGIRSGVVRATVLAGCWEALKLLSGF